MLEKVRILLGVITGIDELHNLHHEGMTNAIIIHGDIKPANILLSNHNPPEVKLADFGLAKFSVDHTMTDLQTLCQKGTLVYAAPEILPDYTHPTGPSKKTHKGSDMYAFAIVMWEVLTLCKPYEDMPHNMISMVKHVQVDHKRPDMTLLPKDVPHSLKRVIESCWNRDYTARMTAREARMILFQTFSTLSSQSFDLFFSHPWKNKSFLYHVYCILNDERYRVWYDMNDMGHDLGRSMDEGVKNSHAVIVCLDKKYQASENCMRELRQAEDNRKPIVVLVTEPDLTWCSEEVKRICGIPNKKYVDLSKFNSFDWENSTKEMEDKLGKTLQELFSILDELGVPKSQSEGGFCAKFSSRPFSIAPASSRHYTSATSGSSSSGGGSSGGTDLRESSMSIVSDLSASSISR